MLGLCHFIFATFPHEKFFTVTVNVTVTVVPPTFWNLAKNWKSIFLGQKYLTEGFFFKTYMKVWVLRHTFLKEKINFHFFNIFYDFLKKNISFSEEKKLQFYTIVSTAKFYNRIRFFGNFPETLGMSGSLENWETIKKLHLVVCGSVRIFFFPENWFWTNWRFH